MERVTFLLLDDGTCLPKVIKSGGKTRDFTGDDMIRVLDFASASDDTGTGGGNEDVEEDAIMWMCTRDENSKSSLSFPKRRMCLRGGYLFFFNHQEESKEGMRPAPLGVIPLDSIVVDFPPGGRRVFREHADSSPRNGYEFCLRHKPATDKSLNPFGQDSDEDDENIDDPEGLLLMQRPNHYLVAETLGQRESWSKALRVRVEACAKRETTLRTGAAGLTSSLSTSPFHPANLEDHFHYSPANLFQKHTENSYDVEDENNPFSYITVSPEEQEEIEAALDQFGGRRKTTAMADNPNTKNSPHDEDDMPYFDENEWVDDYFQKHEDFDAPAIYRTLDKWQVAVKKGLRGAVLEQYEYFVDASRVMTTMGREVANLRNLTEMQLQTIQTMKEIDFASALNNISPSTNLTNGGYNGTMNDDDSLMMLPYDEDDDEEYSTDEEDENGGFIAEEEEEGDQLIFTDKKSLSRTRAIALRTSTNFNINPDHEYMEIPEWLDDVMEEISAFIKECRYTDATELLLKARNEVNDILNQVSALFDYILTSFIVKLMMLCAIILFI